MGRSVYVDREFKMQLFQSMTSGLSPYKDDVTLRIFFTLQCLSGVCHYVLIAGLLTYLILSVIFLWVAV